MSEQVEVYISTAVAEVRQLHESLADPAFRALPIRVRLKRQAECLLGAHGAGDSRACHQLSNWWPPVIGQPCPEIMAAAVDLAAARFTIAREYGYPDWAAVEALGEAASDAGFETALDALMSGDLVGLQQLLDADPGLVTARSSYGHRACLLHHLAANGVETHRQVTPLNAVALARLLIERGADAMAEAEMYGGGQTPLALVVTSAHPAAAGVAEELAALLRLAEAAR